MDWEQIVLKFPVRLARAFNDTARAAGFTKAGFVAHLFAVYRKAPRLDDVQRHVLTYLGVWGPVNGHQGPISLKDLASHTHKTKEAVHAAVEELEKEGLMARGAIRPDAGYRHDVAVSESERLFLTRQGKLAAAARP